MNVNQLLDQPMLETYVIETTAASIPNAHSRAWAALEASLNGEDSSPWVLKSMQYVHNRNINTGQVDFKAEFVRRPDES